MVPRHISRLSAAAGGVLLGLAVVAFAQTPPPGIPEALRIQPKDPAAAAKILEGVTDREPKNARAWRLLGAARQQAKQLETAIAAYRKAVEVGQDPVATYNIAVVYALQKDADRAFEWLGKAKAAKYDMSAMEVDSNLAELKKDSRYAAFVPKPEDFAQPFVEDTKIIAEWKGEKTGDNFGWIARVIGDVDKDGVDDFVTSAPQHATGGTRAGRIYVYSTKSRQLLWKVDGVAGDFLGHKIEAAGDVNKDGIPDVVANGGGTVRVHSGNDGKLLRTFKSPGPLPLMASAGAGDVNGDGYGDIITGSVPPPPQAATAPGAPAPTPPAGAAYLFSGKDGALLLSLTGEREGDLFGTTVAGNTFGKETLLIIGAPGAGPTQTGRAYVYTKVEKKPAFLIDGDQTSGALAAMFVAAVGDIDKDGFPDAFASDFVNRAKGPQTGRVYLHSGKDGRRLLTLTGETPGEMFGTSQSHAGDIDGDGHADLAIGAWQYAAAAMSGGRIYMHSGKDGRLLGTITCQIPGDTLGFDSVGIGDVDKDGTVDLLVTSGYSGVSGYRSGRVFIVSSGVTKS
jgi:hypothetical protein